MTTTQVEYLDQPDAGRYIAVENGQWWMVDGHSSIRIESNKWLWVCDRIGWQQKFKHTVNTRKRERTFAYDTRDGRQYIQPVWGLRRKHI